MSKPHGSDTLDEISMYISDTLILAAGPVILEEGKILLCREIKKDGIESPFFMLPGGGYETDDLSFENTCIREAKEELGIDIEILRPLQPLFVKRPDKDGYAILIHFLARRKNEIVAGESITEWGWFDINNLPPNCAPNIHEVLQSYLNEPKI